MTIEVLGSGCPTCKKMFEAVKQTVTDMHLDTEVQYSTDVQRMVSMGVIQSPVLAIDGRAVMTGFTPDHSKIREIIHAHLANAA